MTDDAAATTEITSDLCILGAGISGLNALFAASRYLSRNQKVVLVDRNATAGGMWLSTYDYVRLHQPHPMFTAGNIPWTLGRESSYLAARPEVVDHLAHCVETLRRRVTLDERYGYEYRSHDEKGAGSDEVLVHCASTTPGAPALRIKTKKLIKSFGYDVQRKDPLALTSNLVRSISPNTHDVLGDEMAQSDAPVYIAGGGKTGMDTAHALITRFPKKRVSLLIGSGTMFGCRDTLHPNGLRRFWTGSTPLATFLDLAQRFDGHNERAVRLEHLRRVLDRAPRVPRPAAQAPALRARHTRCPPRRPRRRRNRACAARPLQRGAHPARRAAQRARRVRGRPQPLVSRAAPPVRRAPLHRVLAAQSRPYAPHARHRPRAFQHPLRPARSHACLKRLL